MFEQLLDPTGHVWLSVLISLVPLIALLFMLAALRMTAWLAPILVFTMEEAWLCRHPGTDGSVHLRQFPTTPTSWRDESRPAFA